MSIIRRHLNRQHRLLRVAVPSTPPPPPPPPAHTRSSLAFRRSPLLLLAAVLVALAVLFAPGAQPAWAQQSFWTATLTPANLGSDFLGCFTAHLSCGNSSNLSEDEFTYGGASYRVARISLKSGTLEFVTNKSIPDSLKDSKVALVVDGTSLAFSDATRGTGLGVTNAKLEWTNTGLSWTVGGTVSLSLTEPITMTAEFGEGVTIPDKTYQVGVDVNETYTEAHDQGLPRLPEVTVEFGVEAGEGQYKVVYTATDLPAGLTLGAEREVEIPDSDPVVLPSDRVIRGVPTEATTEAVEVTYTATVTFYTAVEDPQEGEPTVEEAGTSTASLTFNVTVNPADPPVTFDAEAQKFFSARTVVWVPGSGWRNNVLPEAQGGAGTITYSLINNDTGAPLADGTPITFNAATRTIGGTPWEGTSYAVTYIATDENGATAQGYIQVRHGVGGL